MTTTPHTIDSNKSESNKSESNNAESNRRPSVAERSAASAAARAAAAARKASTGTATGGAHVGPTRAPARKRRRHPAHKSRVAALTLSLAGTGAMTVGMFRADHASALAVSNSVSTAVSTAASTKTSTASTATATASSATSTSTLKSGTYTGAASSNRWGIVQVKVTVSGGKITNVVALQTPSSKPKSVQINQRAVPILKSEAITAQSSNIANVSGATYTSDSYKVSLQSAIDQATGATATAA